MTIDRGSWGYRRNVDLGSYLNPHQLLSSLVSTVRYVLATRTKEQHRRFYPYNLDELLISLIDQMVIWQLLYQHR